MHFVLLPGLDGTGELFEEFVGATPEGCEVTVVSYPPDEELSYDECVNYAAGRLPSSGPFFVLGESFSGPVAISLSARHPPGLVGVVLCNTFACAPAWRGFARLPWTALFSLRLNRFTAGLHLVGFSNTGQWIERIREANRKTAPRVLARRMREVLSVDVRDRLESIRVPILYLRGTRDRLVGRGSLDRILDRRPDVQVAPIDAPHLTLQLEPELSWAAIDGFLPAARGAGGRDAPLGATGGLQP